MSETKSKERINRSFCEHCSAIVPVHHEARDGKMYLVKDCPNCGKVETCVSSDAKRYMEKRQMCGYEGEAQHTCNLKCVGCNHGFKPKLVHVDVTNHCNMNCPICCANVHGMGFDFNPPLEYFDKIFRELESYDPKPRIQFFGGEPTARDDFLDIVRLARKYGFPTRVVTNGIRMADKKFCDELLDTRAYLLFGFDGRDPEIYQRMRKSPRVLDLKLKALENIRKYNVPEDGDGFSTRRMTILCTLGIDVNDKSMPDFIDFCHECREQVAVVAFIPLQVTPGPEQIAPRSTSIEDAERIVGEALPGTEFLPAAMLQMFKTIEETYGVRITLGGSHPNCESVTLLIAGKDRYYPVSDFLKGSFREVVEDVIAWDRRMGEKLKRSRLARLFGKPYRTARVSLGVARLALKHLRIGRFLGDQPVRNVLRMTWRKITTGKQWKKLARRYLGCRGILRMIVLPYEDKGWLESARLKTCPVAFAYEDPDTEKVELMPFCTYFVYKNEILRKTAEKWGGPGVEVEEKAPDEVGACKVHVG